jgi:hypothetical protein
MTVDAMEELVRKENEKAERHPGKSEKERASGTSEGDEYTKIVELAEDDDDYDNIVSFQSTILL